MIEVPLINTMANTASDSSAGSVSVVVASPPLLTVSAVVTPRRHDSE